MAAGLVHALATDSGPGPLVHLLGRPRVSHEDHESTVVESGARVLAYLALNSGANERRHVATTLWPDADDARATGNLRTALWRLNGTGLALVEAGQNSLRLARGVQVDVRLLGDWAARVISGHSSAGDLRYAPWDVEHLEMLAGWYDDWILLERERLRQRLLHALEVLGRALILQRRFAEAVDVALVASTADPLRESAQQVLIEAYLAEGNRVEARRRYDDHRRVLLRELGVPPSPRLTELVGAAADA